MSEVPLCCEQQESPEQPRSGGMRGTRVTSSRFEPTPAQSAPRVRIVLSYAFVGQTHGAHGEHREEVSTSSRFEPPRERIPKRESSPRGSSETYLRIAVYLVIYDSG